MTNKAHKEVRHEWVWHSTFTFPGGGVLHNIHVCEPCGGWTANEPAYRYDVCDAKDRRKLPERRSR